MNIGAKINNLMKENNITQEILADYTGVSQTKIHDIVSGKTQKVDFFFMQKICEIFEVGFEYFVEEKETSINIKKVENNPNSNIGCKIEAIHHHFPEGILENMLKRIENLENTLQQNK